MQGLNIPILLLATVTLHRYCYIASYRYISIASFQSLSDENQYDCFRTRYGRYVDVTRRKTNQNIDGRLSRTRRGHSFFSKRFVLVTFPYITRHHLSSTHYISRESSIIVEIYNGETIQRKARESLTGID